MLGVGFYRGLMENEGWLTLFRPFGMHRLHGVFVYIVIYIVSMLLKCLGPLIAAGG